MPDTMNDTTIPITPSQPQKSGIAGFFAKLGAGLKGAAPAIQQIGDSLISAGGSPLQQESLQNRQQLGLQRTQLGMQQQVQQSGLDTAALQRQHLGQEISAFRTPEQTADANLAQQRALLEQQKLAAAPADIVGQVEGGGYGHYERKYIGNDQYDTNPTMVNRQVQNPAVISQQAGSDAENSVGGVPAGPLTNPPLPQNVNMGRSQLMAVSKPLSTSGDIEPDGNSPTGFSRVWRGANYAEVHREPAPAPGAYVPSSTEGSNTVLKQDQNGNWVAVNEPHSSKKNPTLPIPPNPNRSNLTPPNPQAPPATMPNTGNPKSSPRSNLSGPKATPVTDAAGNPLHAPLSADGKKTLRQVSTSDQMLNSVLPDLTAVVSDIGRGSNLYDAAQTRSAWLQYNKLGLDPNSIDPNSIASQFPNVDPRIAKIFPAISMMKVVLAQPFMNNSRNFMFMQQIQQHVPDPEKDTPQLMLSKAQWIKQSLPMIKNAVYESEGINTTPPPTPNTNPNRPPLASFEGKH